MDAVQALPAGDYNGSSFNNVGNNGNWWTATANGSSNAYNRNMNYNNANVNCPQPNWRHSPSQIDLS